MHANVLPINYNKEKTIARKIDRTSFHDVIFTHVAIETAFFGGIASHAIVPGNLSIAVALIVLNPSVHEHVTPKCNQLHVCF